MGKVAHLCKVETYSNSPCPRYWASYGVVSQLVFIMGWVGMSCFGKCVPAVVPCATADVESGSGLKLGYCMDQPLVLLGTRKLVLKMFLSNEPLHKILLSANQTLALSLIYPVHYILFIPPWVWLNLLSTFVLTPFLIFTEEDRDFVPEDVE